MEVGAPVTQAFLGARSLQAGLSRGGTPPAVLAWWREEKEVGDLFLDQNQHGRSGNCHRPSSARLRAAARRGCTTRRTGRPPRRPRPSAPSLARAPQPAPPQGARTGTSSPVAPAATLGPVRATSRPARGGGRADRRRPGDSWLSPEEDDRDVPVAADQALRSIENHAFCQTKLQNELVFAYGTHRQTFAKTIGAQRG